MELALQLWPEFVPVPDHDVSKIKVFFPIFEYFLVDLTGKLVINSLRKTSLLVNRRPATLPSVPLVATQRVLSQDKLAVIALDGSRNHSAVGSYETILVCFVSRVRNTAVAIPISRNWGPLKLTVIEVGVIIVVHLNGCVVCESDTVRACSERVAEFVRVENLMSRRNPAASATTEYTTCPTFADSSETALDFRDELVHNSITKRPRVLAVDGIRIVKEGRLVVDSG